MHDDGITVDADKDLKILLYITIYCQCVSATKVILSIQILGINHISLLKIIGGGGL